MLNYISANMITNNYTSRFLYYVFVHGHVATLHLELIQPSRVAAKLGLWFCLVYKYKYIKLYTMMLNIVMGMIFRTMPEE